MTTGPLCDLSQLRGALTNFPTLIVRTSVGIHPYGLRDIHIITS